MNNVITTINRPSSIKVLSLGKTINIKPAKNSKDSMPKLNAYAVPALIAPQASIMLEGLKPVRQTKL